MKHTGIFETSNDIQTAVNNEALVKPYVALYGSSSNYSVDINSKSIINQLNNYTYVDLGLQSGTLWATCNIGAASPEEYGYYFAWGETSEKTGNNAYDSNWSDYNFGTSASNITKYNATDNKTILDLEDDAAYVIMGESWRIPTDAQIRELRNLSNTWTTLNGVYGRLFTGNNGNTLFIPAAGYKNTGIVNNAGTKCYMWSCNGGGSEGTSGAGYFTFDSGGTDVLVRGRCDGCSCRGVINPS